MIASRFATDSHFLPRCRYESTLFWFQHAKDNICLFLFSPLLSIISRDIIYTNRCWAKSWKWWRTPRFVARCTFRVPSLWLCDRLACIYLATKVEEHNIDVVQFADKLKQKAEDIVKLELPLLQSIRFHLIIYHPYRPLEGFLSQLQVSPVFFPVVCARCHLWWWGFILAWQERGVNIPFDQITCHSKELIQGVLTTDAPLLFPPSQIALAVLKKLANNPEVDKYANTLTYAFRIFYSGFLCCIVTAFKVHRRNRCRKNWCDCGRSQMR